MSELPLTTRLRYLVRYIGLDVNRFSLAAHPDPLFRFLHRFDIRQVLDVGANEGQFGSFLRRQCYRGRIISFEPNPDAFARLQSLSSRDRDWHAWNLGLGSQRGEMILNVSRYSSYSSMLRPTEDLLALDPNSQVIRQCTVPIQTLDDFCAANVVFDVPTLLKLDTQGFERPILQGALSTLHRVNGVQLELSVKNIYDEQPLIEEMIAHMRELGFSLFSLNCGMSDRRTGELMETDGLFFKPHA